MTDKTAEKEHLVVGSSTSTSSSASTTATTTLPVADTSAVASNSAASASGESTGGRQVSFSDGIIQPFGGNNILGGNNGGSGSGGGARLKVVTLGDVACGKTSCIARFMYDAYDRHYRATLGIDFLTKMVSVDGRNVRMQLWDTAGQEKFFALLPSYIRNSAGAILMFDVTNRESFLNTRKWADLVHQERGADSGIVIFLVGNKIDLDDKRAVTPEEGEARARELGASYTEVSAKTGANIKALFRKVATTVPLPPLDDTELTAAAAAASSIAPIRRIDPLLVTPARTTAALNNQQQPGGGDAASSYCGAC